MRRAVSVDIARYYVDINLFVKIIARDLRKEMPVMHVQPYLNFDGRCDEALEFYKKAIGAKVGMLMRCKDTPDKSMITPATRTR